MAERRMFAKQIIDSDIFLEMPVSAQLLYFHLAMRADDDGFINKPKSIMRLCGCKDDDMKILINKQFVIPFESGIVVIKHWKIHNYIQKDRYRGTVYKQEKDALSVVDGTYEKDASYVSKTDTYMYPECIQPVSRMDTQVIDRDRDRLKKGYSQDIDKHNTSQSDAESEVNFKEILSLFCEICVSLPKPYQLNDARKARIRKINKELKGDFRSFFERIEKSDFLTGRAEKCDFKASFDWVMKPANFVKIIEGNYDNRNNDKQKSDPYGYGAIDIDADTII